MIISIVGEEINEDTLLDVGRGIGEENHAGQKKLKIDDQELNRRQIVNYIRNLSRKGQRDFYSIPWGGAILRNCNTEGELLEFETVHEYEHGGKDLWIHLNIAIFRDQYNEAFCEYICTKCPSMVGMNTLQISQNRELIESRRCHHSKAAGRKIGNDFEDIWGIPQPPPNIEAAQIFLNDDITHVTLKEGNQFLACINMEGKISTIFTVTPSQKQPLCTKCRHRKCPCYNTFVTLNTVEEEEDNMEENNVGGRFPWEKFMTQKCPTGHYDDPIPLDEYYNEYGSNMTDIKHPIKRDPEMHAKWVKRKKGNFDLPSSITAKYVEIPCRHGHLFDSRELENCETKVISNTIKYTRQKLSL